MNIYDKLNDLVSSIQQSEAYQRYKKAAEVVDSDPKHAQLAKDFITIQVRLSTAQMFGQQPDQESIEQFNLTYNAISGIPQINEFIQAQMQFSKIMEDVSKEISKVATLDVDFLKIIPDMNSGE